MYSPMLTTENLAELNDLRGRVLRGEHVPPEELHEALKMLAQSRASASIASAEKKGSRKPSIAVPSGASLLAGITARIKDKEKDKEPDTTT